MNLVPSITRPFLFLLSMSLTFLFALHSCDNAVVDPTTIDARAEIEGYWDVTRFGAATPNRYHIFYNDLGLLAWGNEYQTMTFDKNKAVGVYSVSIAGEVFNKTLTVEFTSKIKMEGHYIQKNSVGTTLDDFGFTAIKRDTTN